MTATLALSMIIKDEPIDRLAMLIEYLKPTVSEFVITDTGSESYEKDKPLMESWGVDIQQIEWPNNFATARNTTLDRINSDWILHLDADELPTRGMMNSIDRVLNECDPQTLGWLFLTRNWWGGETGVVVDAHWHCRLFRNGSGRWYKPLHEQVMLNGMEETQTRETLILPKANGSDFLIHSKPREAIEKSGALYKGMGG